MTELEYNLDKDKRFLKKWSKVRIKGRRYFILIDGGLKGGIQVSVLYTFGMMAIKNLLAWNFFMSAIFWEYLIMSLILFSINTAFYHRRLWKTSENKYQQMIAYYSDEIKNESVQNN